MYALLKSRSNHEKAICLNKDIIYNKTNDLNKQIKLLWWYISMKQAYNAIELQITRLSI